MLASKYEEVYYPCTRSFLKVTEGQVSKSSLLRMECEMLSTLDFELRFPLLYVSPKISFKSHLSSLQRRRQFSSLHV